MSAQGGYERPLKLSTAAKPLQRCYGHREYAALENALKRILRGARDRRAFAGMSWKEVERICADALGEGK